MKLIKIDLSQPFEHVLARVLEAPANAKVTNQSCTETRLKLAFPKDDDLELTRRREVKKVLRSLYEAAHGRQVETSIGLIPIAPPIAAFLKEKPFYITTQIDFLLAALTRIIEMSLRVGERGRRKFCVEARRNPPTAYRTSRLRDEHVFLTRSTYD